MPNLKPDLKKLSGDALSAFHQVLARHHRQLSLVLQNHDSSSMDATRIAVAFHHIGLFFHDLGELRKDPAVEHFLAVVSLDGAKEPLRCLQESISGRIFVEAAKQSVTRQDSPPEKSPLKGRTAA